MTRDPRPFGSPVEPFARSSNSSLGQFHDPSLIGRGSTPGNRESVVLAHRDLKKSAGTV